ncbi:3-keto-disaccharide hydrolase [Tundrisphaera sp. TA3]|uniref:3-keto-disaccharide hydrolase n=1 Tax=Tundrisphaera sp. TA3 TaxID=3435775 RepID=UPI003EB82A9B
MKISRWAAVGLSCLALSGAVARGADGPDPAASKDGWKSLFNGKDLEGWTPKITGYPLGENYADTFRVEDGLLKVRYDKYTKFDRKFGHLFYKDKFSNYRLRIEYRFVGDQCPGGEGWATRNSGVMLHCQAPETMRQDQDFPVSIEVQFLGGLTDKPRATCNACTPGTNVVVGGKLEKTHTINSHAKTYGGDQWVTIEVEVRGNDVIKHIIDGETVLEYEKPQLDERDKDAKELIRKGADLMLKDGFISLQSESHPIDFRRVEIQMIEP